MKFLIFLVMLFCNADAAADLSGKIFTFPKATKTDHVKITPTQQNFTALTVCHRSFTDLTRAHALFSMALPTEDNAFLIFMDSTTKLSVFAHSREVYDGLHYSPNKMQSICTTWDSSSGVAQVWLNGWPLTRKYLSNTVLKGQPIITLGQEQDSHGGGFDINQSFVGMMTDVHMWDHVLSPCEIHIYMKEGWFTPGNVVNWRALNFQRIGNVLIEDRQLSLNTASYSKH